MAKGTHVFKKEIHIPRPRSDVFAFFANAENLEKITPPELSFSIHSPLPIRMDEGTVIEYRLHLFHIPFSWISVIAEWEKDRRFVDEQVKGPYAKWVHRHTFDDAERGTRVMDEVHYRLPLYPLGEMAAPLVKRQLERIFDYRARRLEELLGSGSSVMSD